MLDDFGKRPAVSGQGFGASLAISALLYGGAGAGVVYASVMAHQSFAEEDLIQVELAPPPEPEPELAPPPPPPAIEEPPPAPRRGRPRPELEQPVEIPDDPPDESDEELAPPEDPFAPEGEGDPNGVPGGTGPAIAVTPPPPPEPEPEPLRPRGPVRVIEGSTAPQFDRAEIVQHFEVPAEVRSAGIARITVVVRVTVDADGNLRDVTVLRGHALIPEENIVRAVRATHFEPARMADGTPYAAIHTIPITIAVTL